MLVVEALTAAQEHALRKEIHSWRRPGDHFIYELVVVGNAEEAMIAARLNANLQACVVGRHSAAAAAHDLSSLADFADASIASDLAGQTPDERAQILARRLARLRPELDLYLMADIGVEDIAGYLSHHFRRVFHAQEGLLELHLSILAGWPPGTARRSSKRCGTTATARPACSTRGLQRFPPGVPGPRGRHARGRRAPGVLPVLRRHQL
ncbi:MAG: hypothetical protein ACHQCE_07995 [Streptosporangiales bacterium]